MNRERVKHAIRVLQGVARRKKTRHAKFDLNTWAEFDASELVKFKKKRLPLRLNGCGTSGCAMGWIASSPKAMASGLRLFVDPEGDGAFAVNVRYRGKTGNEFGAPAAYFKISKRTAFVLFSPSTYPPNKKNSPLAVVDRLKEMLRVGELGLVRGRDPGDISGLEGPSDL